MICKLVTLLTLTVFAKADLGFFTGISEGIFLLDEISIENNGCTLPDEPEEFN